MTRTPQRLALTIGINSYPNAELSGCVNDAADMARLWSQLGFAVTAVVDTNATRDVILTHLKAQVDALRYGDRLVVHYSGHGTKVPDRSGDEADGWDEAWVSVDMQPILDDDLAAIFATRAYGSRIVVFSDSCYSGTVQRVGGLGDVLTGTFDPRHPRKRRSIPPGMLAGDALGFGKRDRTLPPAPARAIGSGSDCLLVSGCSDTEYSYDAWFTHDGQWRANGAFTAALLRAFYTERPAEFREWWQALGLPTDEYPQTPQLEGTYRQKRWPVA